MSDSTTSGAQAVAHALRSMGVETAFGLPGVHNLALWPALHDAGIRIVGSRHEQGTVYAADGLARATGGLGVALTTTGPGAANTVGAVGEAWASHSPVVVIATDIPTTQRRAGVYRGVLHESIAQAAMFVAVTKSTIDVADADGIGAAIVTAATIARTAPTGPVYVGIPTDLLDLPAPVIDAPWGVRPDLPEPDLQPVLDAIAASERPLIWIGGGARDAGAQIGALATRLGAPVVTTYQARGVIGADHPQLVGAPPHEPPVIDLIERSDLAIVIGSDLDAMNTMAWRLPLPDRRVAINIDPVDAMKSYSMDATLVAGALIAGALADVVPAREPWAGDLVKLVETLRDELRAAPETAESVAFLEHTEAALPAEAIVFADMCIPGYWLAGHYRVRASRSLHYPMGWGTLGFAFPAAIGAAVGRAAGRPVVSVSGDGGMLFAIGELATAAQEQLPLTAVVVDDGGYGMLRYGHDPGADLGTELAPVDFAAVARGFGIEARTVDGAGDGYRAALTEAVASGAPNLLHVRAALYPPRSTSPRWPLRGA